MIRCNNDNAVFINACLFRCPDDFTYVPVKFFKLVAVSWCIMSFGMPGMIGIVENNSCYGYLLNISGMGAS